MAVKKEGLLLSLAIAALAVSVAAVALSTPRGSLFRMIVRLSALYGYLTLSIAAVMTPFVRQIMKVFGEPFIKVHHIFATLGIILLTVHPVAHVIDTLDPRVFLPSFESWFLFWAFAGRPALIILYVAVLSALLRRKIQKRWRTIHALTYVVLFFGIVHATLIGPDFENPGIRLVFISLYSMSSIGFALKRLQQYRIRKVLSQRKDRASSESAWPA